MYPPHSLASADGSLYAAPPPIQGFDYQDAVGESLIEIMRATPGGVLVSSHVEVWGHVLWAHISFGLGWLTLENVVGLGYPCCACFVMEWCARGQCMHGCFQIFRSLCKARETE